MTRFYMATGDGLAVVTQRDDTWEARIRLPALPSQCVAANPLRPEVVYCGTFGHGLWRSDDAGETWQHVDGGMFSDQVMAVAFSRVDPGVVWVGTEPSALFFSEDGGRTWHERTALRQIPSAPTWSFPPRPWTHHVRWIEPDANASGRLFVAIELGGVMKSEDGGVTWEDRKPASRLDGHTLRTHRLAPGRLYEAAGDGYAESLDAGATWKPGDEGLPWHYLWSLAVDPADPAVRVVSLSPGPRHAHDPMWQATGDWHDQSNRAGAVATRPSGETARFSRLRGRAAPPPWVGYDWRGPESWLYRKRDGDQWACVTEGLPAARGTVAYVLATNEAEPHVFYASPWNDAIYRSVDAGETWQRIPVVWPDDYARRPTLALLATAD